jgi:hypothetical protein
VNEKGLHSKGQDQAGAILVNRFRRAVRLPGCLGARVQGGSIGSTAAAGMGDCLLLDFSRQFFAVADGSDRNPSLSREFMKQFAAMLERSLPAGPQRIYGEMEVGRLKNHLRDKSDHLLQTLSFGDGCTFTGLLLLQCPEGPAGLLFHTGDSLLFSCNLKTGRTRQWSKNNFWLVGRTSHFYQVETRPLHPQTRLLLATDGLAPLLSSPSEKRETAIRTLFEGLSPDEIPDRLLDARESRTAGRDDRSVITLDPGQMPGLKGSLLLGGTSREEEQAFQEGKKKGALADRYLPLDLAGETASRPVG